MDLPIDFLLNEILMKFIYEIKFLTLIFNPSVTTMSLAQLSPSLFKYLINSVDSLAQLVCTSVALPAELVIIL